MNGNLFDTVVLSGDTVSGFLEFFPMVKEAWETIWGVDVVLGIVSPVLNFSLLGTSSKVVMVQAVKDVPLKNQAKLLRFWLAASLKGKVCLIHDLDFLPLDKWYLEERLSKRQPGHLHVAESPRHYTGLEEQGKFPIGDMVAESETFQQLLGASIPWDLWINCFAISRLFKTDIKANIMVDFFSDESWWRTLLTQIAFSTSRICKTEGLLYPFSDRIIDRANWFFSKKQLQEHYYYGAHLPRPFDPSICAPLINYIRTTFGTSKE